MKTLLFSIFICISGFLVAQIAQPYGVWEQSPGNYWFVQVDPATGNKTNIAAIPGVNAFVAGEKTTFDSDRGYYHFVGHNGANPQLFTINASNGAVVSNPVFTENVVGLEYNCNDSLIYGLWENNNVYTLVTVNPDSATLDTIKVLSGINAYVGGSFSLDAKKGWYNCVVLDGSQFYLRSFDIFTGNRINDNAFPDNVVNHEFNCEDSTVYGMWDQGNQYLLEKIDLVTGSHTTAGVISSASPGNISDATTINDSGEYTFRGFMGATIAVHSLDLSTASSIYATAQPDNVVGWEEPFCCEGKKAPADTTGDTSGTSVVDVIVEMEVQISPNPVKDKLYIKANKPIQTISIWDAGGRYIEKFASSKSSGYVDVKHLPHGVYMIRLRTVKGVENRQIIIAR